MNTTMLQRRHRVRRSLYYNHLTASFGVLCSSPPLSGLALLSKTHCFPWEHFCLLSQTWPGFLPAIKPFPPLGLIPKVNTMITILAVASWILCVCGWINLFLKRPLVALRNYFLKNTFPLCTERTQAVYFWYVVLSHVKLWDGDPNCSHGKECPFKGVD